MTTRTTTSVIAVALAAALALSACGGAPDPAPADAAADAGFPVTIENCGVEQTFDAPPSRVLLGAPGVAATLDELGVGDAIIGTTLSDFHDDAIDAHDLETQTPDYAPSREFMLAAAPDLFLANDEGQLSGDAGAGRDDLASVGGSLVVLGGYCADSPAPGTVDVVYDDIEQLGAIFGVSERADELNTELRRRVADAAASTAGQRPSTALVSVYDGKVYALRGAGYGAIAESLGLQNVFDDLDGNFAEIGAESVLAADPDVIIVTFAGDGDAEAAAIDEASALFAGSAAVENGRVVGLDETDLQSAGVRIIDAIEKTADKVAG